MNRQSYIHSEVPQKDPRRTLIYKVVTWKIIKIITRQQFYLTVLVLILHQNY